MTDNNLDSAVGGSGSRATNGTHFKWWALAAAICVLAIFAGVWSYNELVLEKPLSQVLLQDPRNQFVKASAHFAGWVDPNTVEFDIDDISGQASMVDVLRIFLQFAQTQKTNLYKQVILSAFGQRKFVLSGAYFQQLGAEYGTQNPIYTARTFAQHITALDGSAPFPEPQGGFLYVLGEEMNQFKQFNEQWYLNDYISKQK